MLALNLSGRGSRNCEIECSDHSAVSGKNSEIEGSDPPRSAVETVILNALISKL